MVGEVCIPDRFDRDAFLPPLRRHHTLWLCAPVFRFEEKEMPFCCLARLEAAFCRLFWNTKKSNDYSVLVESVTSRRNTKKGLFTRHLLLLLPEMYFALLSCTLNAMIRCHQGALSDGG